MVKWHSNALLIRRSHAEGKQVMENTKQGTRYRITLPAELLGILGWHVDRLPAGPMKDSDLLFPSETGGFRATTVLQEPFADVCRAMGLKKRITAKAMRRTFQDLAREAEIDGIVKRSICGHATEEMLELYSTVGQKEIERAVRKVISLTGYKRITSSEPGEGGVRIGFAWGS